MSDPSPQENERSDTKAFIAQVSQGAFPSPHNKGNWKRLTRYNKIPMQIIKLSEEVETAFPQYSLHLYKERYKSETQCPPKPHTCY